MRFFFDNNLSPHFATAMRELESRTGVEIVHIWKKFQPDTPDPVWINTLGAEGGWIIISGDAAISTSPAERAAWLESKLTAFFLAAPFPSDGYWSQAHQLVGWWPKIVAAAKRTPTEHGYLLQKKAKELRLLRR